MEEYIEHCNSLVSSDETAQIVIDSMKERLSDLSSMIEGDNPILIPKKYEQYSIGTKLGWSTYKS